ncbi:MAG: bifunctional DNA-formamidopyrimidine glycosylase/DNA-(apurinic or apyrimidinic site) lyase [Bradymonadales bacterium]|nr:bifunctional DNA-formamidopyrimidine glycosylase/DNA-(apurinic or apyrimidinic site) lyase [Bradymonadales bacterium]
MPELPEVEVIRRGLEQTAIGRRIARVEVADDRVVSGPPEVLKSRLVGQSVQALSRRGKVLIIELEQDCLLVHLGMTGQLTFWDRKREDDAGFVRHPSTGLQRARQHAIDKHTHLWIRFEDGNGLHYRDIRKFGRIRLVSREERMCSPMLQSLGLEPFTEGYRLEPFERLLAGRKRSIKALLLDQHLVAGLGNIYSDEALFVAGIDPRRVASSLTRPERLRLFEAIPAVLARGIDLGGTSLRDFVNARGEAGGNQEELFVYGRTGQPCRRCQASIERIVLAQRSTHYCPVCQKAGIDGL